MRNQQIFEANSGFKICLHFSIIEAKTGLKNGVGLYGFQACSGIVFSVCVRGVRSNLAKPDAQGFTLNDGLLA